MRSGSSPLGACGARRLAAALLVVVGLASAALARQTASPAGSGPTPKSRGQAQAQRQAGLENLALVAGADAADPRQVRAAVGEVKRDFERLQVLRNEIVRQLKGGGAPDYKSLASKAGEIRKRAGRLKTLLVLYAPEDDGRAPPNEAEIDAAHMSSALVTLCLSIDRFVENPVFEMQGVVDAKQSTQAGGDLLTIIALSERIQRSAERLRR